MTHLEAQLEQLITILQAPKVDQDDELWTDSQVGAYLGITRRVVREQYIYKPGFPAPVAYPTKTGTRPEVRWIAAEVKAWVKALPRHGVAA